MVERGYLGLRGGILGREGVSGVEKGYPGYKKGVFGVERCYSW